MARPIRIQYPGAFYHIMARGNERSDIFKKDFDFEIFLDIFSEVLEKYNWQCFAYCLMPNHYHILVKTHEPTLSIGMRQLNGKYTQKFNFFHKRTGHLFQGRFKSVLVEEEKYKNELIRYIALNPVRSKLAKKSTDWKWNSCLEVIGKKSATGCVDVKAVLRQFDESSAIKARRYFLEYLNSKIEKEIEIEKIRGGIILGSNIFLEKVKSYFKNQEQALEIPIRERLAFRPSLEEIFKKKAVNKYERNRLIVKAHIDHGYSLSEIGRRIGLHYSSVGKIVNKKINSKKS